MLSGCDPRVYKDEGDGSLLVADEEVLCFGNPCNDFGGVAWCHAQGGVPLEADASVVFQLFYDTGHDCVSDEHGSCEVTLKGNELTIDAEMSWLARDDWCNDGTYCQWVRCETPPLAAGGYTVRAGSRNYSFSVPSEHPIPWVEDW